MMPSFSAAAGDRSIMAATRRFLPYGPRSTITTRLDRLGPPEGGQIVGKRRQFVGNEEMAFADEQKRNAHEEMAFADEQKRNAHEEMAFADEQKRNAHEEMAFAHEQKRNACEEMAFADEQSET